MSCCLNLALLPMLLVQSNLAARPIETRQEKPVCVIYPIGDLIDRGIEDKEPANKRAKELIHAITETVEPESWKANAGLGKIAFLSNGSQMAVLQQHAVHEKVEQFLERLRDLLELHVSYEIVVLAVPWDLYAQADGVHLDRNAWERFLKDVQKDKKSKIVQVPKLMAQSGVTRDVELPNCKFELKGVVSADRRNIELHIKSKQGNSAMPKFETSSLQPDGSTLLLGGSELAGPEQNRVLVLGVRASIVVPEEEEERLGAIKVGLR